MRAPFSKVLLPGLLLALPAGALGQEESLPPADVVRETLEEWVETKQIASRERSDWEAERATLAELNGIRKSEIEQLSAFIEAAGERVAEIEEKREEFAAEKSDLENWRRQLEASLAKLESRLRDQLDRFPPPLAAEVAEAAARVRDPDSDRPLQHRTRDLLVILQAWIEFHDDITIDGEFREMDGEKREIDVLYLGTTRAWFVDQSDTRAGYGVPSPAGWTWTRDDGLAPRIREAIAVRQRQAPPALVELPFAGSNETGSAPEAP